MHVPKTIDNDIPLPGGFSTFGYQTARHVGVEVVQSLMEDAKSIGRWYLIITMGRRSGQLALGIGKAAGATLTLIPEEFDKKRITIDELMLPIEGSILRRRADGRNDGVVVLAEGLAEKIDPDELKRMHPVDRDPHGKIRLTDLPLGYTLRRRLNERFERRGFKANIMEKLIGYELRGAPPIPFDAEYTRDLGFAATRALLSRNRSGIVCRNAGVIGVVPFKDFMDPTTGEMRVRCVDTSTESFLVSKRYQIRMRKQDLEDPAMRKKLAIAGCMTEEELLEHFAPILNED